MIVNMLYELESHTYILVIITIIKYVGFEPIHSAISTWIEFLADFDSTFLSNVLLV